MLFSSKLPFAYSDTANIAGRTENGEQKPPSSPHAVKKLCLSRFYTFAHCRARSLQSVTVVRNKPRPRPQAARKRHVIRDFLCARIIFE